MLVATDRIIANVEGMIFGGYVGIVATLHDERIGLASHHMNLGNEQTIDVPRDAPADVAYKKGCSKKELTSSFSAEGTHR